MKDISNLTIERTFLFRQDSIPFAGLLAPGTIERAFQPFRFGVAGTIIQEPSSGKILELQMANGSFDVDKEKSLIVGKLDISERKIHFTIGSTFEESEKFFRAVLDSISGATQVSMSPGTDILVSTIQTSCAVTLDFSFETFFSPRFLSFLQGQAQQLMSISVADVNVRPFKFSAEVSYAVKDESLHKHKIMVSNKPLVIEPRVNTPFEENRFFTSSPCDPETHFNLLRALEDSMR
ncbi:MAG: hypothetical protein HYY65_06145 [Candidatus Tectomicrobia bacterium]|uniref:Uncharacterized protein n=1 Tax=Tectimicrobiota bacterium TaxID=2528274 RepID=A0A932GNX7_UNCTE|nr:hypothetical protein [Candidatus Tectomicrobia bacterium]